MQSYCEKSATKNENAEYFTKIILLKFNESCVGDSLRWFHAYDFTFRNSRKHLEDREVVALPST